MLNYVLDEFINYLATVKNYSPRTLPGYRASLNKFFVTEKIQLPSDINVEKCEAYQALRIEQGMSRNTNATFMNALRAFLIFCNKRSYTNAQIEMFEVPKRKRTRVEFVTESEVNAMLLTIHRERDRLLLLTLYTSGCRVSELMQMAIETFTDNKFTVLAKGGKPHVYYMDEGVADRLRTYIMMEGITNGPMFRTTTGRPLQIPAITHIVRKAATLAKVCHNVSPHQFRHGFATASLEAGADIRTIQEMLGHENIQTTMRYAHVTDKRMQETHARYAPKVTNPTYFNKRPVSVPSWL